MSDLYSERRLTARPGRRGPLGELLAYAMVLAPLFALLALRSA